MGLWLLLFSKSTFIWSPGRDFLLQPHSTLLWAKLTHLSQTNWTQTLSWTWCTNRMTPQQTKANKRMILKWKQLAETQRKENRISKRKIIKKKKTVQLSCTIFAVIFDMERLSSRPVGLAWSQMTALFSEYGRECSSGHKHFCFH